MNAHQSPGNLSFWIHDTNLMRGWYPTSIASDNGAGNGPHTSSTFLIGGGWGGMVAQYEIGGWFSSQWGPPVDLGPGDVEVHRNIGKQLANGNILFIGLTTTLDIIYRVYNPQLNSQIAAGIVADSMHYWGFDINGGIAYVFYYDDNLNLYFKTTPDGINWSPQQTYNILWPAPYPINIICWTQMAVTDGGNPLLVFDNINGDDTTYPYYSKVYVSYAPGQPCIEVSSTFAAPDTECFYPTIATGGNIAAVLYCMPRNNEPDSLNWWDFYVVWSTDNGQTWGTPQNYTQSLTHRPGLPQIAKRIDTSRNRVYYVYGVDKVRNIDPFWHVASGGTDPMYICFDYASYVGIEESEGLKVEGEKLRLMVSPSIITDNARIQYTISKTQRIGLYLYDILGRKIATIIEGNIEAEIHTYNLDLSNLSAGIYFLILEGENEKRTQKLLIVR